MVDFSAHKHALDNLLAGIACTTKEIDMVCILLGVDTEEVGVEKWRDLLKEGKRIAKCMNG